MTSTQNNDIKIRLEDGNWVNAYNYQNDAFNEYNRLFNSSIESTHTYNYNNNDIIFSISRLNPDRIHGGTYLIRDNNTISPIADWNNVKVFIDLNNYTSWYSARDYQTWAYMHFIYSNQPMVGYYTINTDNPPNGYIQIPINGIEPNIIFLISRNTNGTIYYQKNDNDKTKIRISDNNDYRKNYQAFFNRIVDQ